MIALSSSHRLAAVGEREKDKVLKFFVPHATDPVEAENVWSQVRAFIQKTTNYPAIKQRRVYHLEYTEGGKLRAATVGKGQILIILESEHPPAYLICTPDRGVLQGEPILIGPDRVLSVQYFEETPTV